LYMCVSSSVNLQRASKECSRFLRLYWCPDMTCSRVFQTERSVLAKDRAVFRLPSSDYERIRRASCYIRIRDSTR
jgi:hypothetical protein